MKVILVGNQNSGKTTLFNSLTNSSEKVGNWPGVTIDQKETIMTGTNHILVDLPGIYSLSPYSSEELISVNYLLNSTYDLIINVVDINSLERSLYLTTQLLELNIPMIIVLTMVKKYKEINEIVKILNHKLEIPVYSINEINFNKITIDKCLKKNLKIFSNAIESIVQRLDNSLMFNRRYDIIQSIMKNSLYYKNLEIKYNMEIYHLIAYQRYKFIEKIIANVHLKSRNDYKIDKIIINKYLAIPIFLLIMLMVYYISFIITSKYINPIIINFINIIQNYISYYLNIFHIYDWLVDFIVKCIIVGIGSVFLFIPQIFLLFFLIGMLNQTGYINRMVFILDGLLNKIGLSGRSLISFIAGFGCSVPAILQSRIIANKAKREKTILLIPFIPCSAKIPLIMIITNYFYLYNIYFPIIIYIIAIILVIISSFILKKIYYLEKSNYIMELPRYKLPSFSYIMRDVLIRLKEFIKKTGSIIIISTIIIWFLLSFNLNLKYNVNIEESILAFIGKHISFLFYPFLGTNNWIASVAIIEGLFGKEQVISFLSVISNNKLFNSHELSFFTPLSALSFLTFNL